jgi:hypothetical protein
MNENINIHNIKPFFNKKIIDYNDDLIELIKNVIKEGLPLLPSLNFNNFILSGISGTPPSIPPGTTTLYMHPGTSPPSVPSGGIVPNVDNIGTQIINSYYYIKVNLRKLEIIKNFILSILESNKYDLMQNIRKEKYKLNNNKLIIVFKKTYYDTFIQYNNIKKNINNIKFRNEIKNFPVFVTEFIKNNYGLLKDNTEKLPFFLKIFQKEYNNKNKNFYKKLFNKYIDIRNNLINYLNNNNNNYGILAFNFIFNLPKEKFINKLNSNNNKNNKNNLNDYIIIDSNKSENNYDNNNNIKKGNYVYLKNLSKRIVSNINYETKNKEKYTLKDSAGIEDGPYSINNFAYVKKRKEAKKTLDKKINGNDLLYKNIFDEEYFKKKHLNNINKLYLSLYSSSQSLFGNNIGESIPLYNIIKYSLLNDFNIFNFIFNYVDPLLINNVIDINYYLKANISHNIENLDSYYDQYIDWFNQFKYDIDFKEEGSILNEHLNSIVFLFLSMIFI